QRHHFSYTEIECLRQKLLYWYDQHKRDLPWRRMVTISIFLLNIPVQLSQPDPNIRAYAEVMLQQTQVKTVTVYYDRWMKKWPTVDALAAASLEEVNTYWSGLGYYSRARMLHEGAKKVCYFFVHCPKVVAEFNGEIPRTADLLKLKMPGVGRYTAGAIASIVFNEVSEPCATEYHNTLSESSVFWNVSENICQTAYYLTYSTAIPHMRFAVLVIVHVVQDHFISSLGVTNYPVKSSKRLPRTETTAVIVAFSDCTDQHQFLLFRRPKTGLLAGLWEFPSQIVMTPASDSGTAIQSAFDTLLLTIATVLSTPESTRSLWKTKHLGEVLHIFSHIRMTYVVRSLEVCPGDSSSSSLSCRWFQLSELECAPIPTVAKKILDHFRRSTSPGSSDKTNHRKSRKKIAAKEGTTSKQLRLDKFFN
ncbi:A/G-specific adenine glycosylase, partial [Paragonimus westermani]